jgi:hypothetical protein
VSKSKSESQKHSQQDAAELLQHLLAYAKPLAYEGGWQARLDTEVGPEVLEIGQLSKLLSMAIVGRTVQDTIDGWGTGDSVRALVGQPPPLLILHLARFSEDGSSKDSRQLTVEPGGQVAVPCFSGAGMEVAMRSYRIAAIVMHLGDTPRSGHYQSVLSVRHMALWRFWLLDDNRLPRLLKASEQNQLRENSYLIFLFRRELE